MIYCYGESKLSTSHPAELTLELRDQDEQIPIDAELDNPDSQDIQEVTNELLADPSDEKVREADRITDSLKGIFE